MRTPKIELLWWEGCPSTDKALAQLREALRDVGLADARVELREIRSDEEAAEAGFRGSPTIRLDGADLVPDATGEPIGLSCRVYRRRDGRISPTPDPADLRETLAAATGAGEPHTSQARS
jgi:hypothetical protein